MYSLACVSFYVPAPHPGLLALTHIAAPHIRSQGADREPRRRGDPGAHRQQRAAGGRALAGGCGLTAWAWVNACVSVERLRTGIVVWGSNVRLVDRQSSVGVGIGAGVG